VATDKQRREAERRRLQRQLERRREQELRRRRLTLIASVVGTLLVVALVVTFIVVTSKEHSSSQAAGTPSSTAPSSTAAATSAATPKPGYPCDWARSGTAAKQATLPSTTKPPRTGTTAVQLATTRGALTLTLNRAAAPCTVESFVSLAAQKYFDGTPCHRLTSSATLKVLQCGDPTGSGSGGPGYAFADELSGKEKYSRGVVAMANSGPNTNGSQFFLVYGNSRLSPNYTVFGTVTKGLPVLDAVAAKGSTPAGDGKPKLSVSIIKATTAGGPG
jgi:peptidyl-prolyl cis-trans isomerase B (cyclophilin B)